jgi:uncharacterized protein YneF (UPF0154 family)
MSRFIEFILRVVMGIILSVAAVLTGLIMGPFVALRWISKRLDELIKSF